MQPLNSTVHKVSCHHLHSLSSRHRTLSGKVGESWPDWLTVLSKSKPTVEFWTCLVPASLRHLVEGVSVCLGPADFLFEERFQVAFAVDDLYDFLQFGENEKLLRQPGFRILDGGRREAGIGNEYAADVPATIDAYQVRGNLLSANGRIPPFHLIVTDHATVDCKLIVERAALVIDTRNALRGVVAANIIRL